MSQSIAQLCVNPALKYIIVADASRFVKRALVRENPKAQHLDKLVEDAMSAAFDHMNSQWAQYTGVTVSLYSMIYQEIIGSSIIEPVVKMFFTFHKTIAKHAIRCIIDSFRTELRKTS